MARRTAATSKYVQACTGGAGSGPSHGGRAVFQFSFAAFRLLLPVYDGVVALILARGNGVERKVQSENGRRGGQRVRRPE
jgi:hypothetical protein